MDLKEHLVDPNYKFEFVMKSFAKLISSLILPGFQLYKTYKRGVTL